MTQEIFQHDGFDIAYADAGGGEPALLIHGFASSAKVNWISTGWTSFLNGAGYRTVAPDNRGHGSSTKSYDAADYAPGKMAEDAAQLLARLGIKKAHVIGYSMGARVSAFLAMLHPALVQTLTLGGLGIGLIDGVGDWDPIAAALSADAPDEISDARGAAFRKFADATQSDRRALAACIVASRQLVSRRQAAQIKIPALIAVGTMDDIAGSAMALAQLMPDARAFDIENRDHMLAVGDRSFKKRTLEFLAEHPI